MAQVTSAITDADKQRIRDLCKKNDWNQSQFLRMLIRDYFDSSGKPKDKPKNKTEIRKDDNPEFNDKVDFVLKEILESEGD